MDGVAAEALVERQPAAVLNAAASTSGRYPNAGPQILLDAGVRAVVAPGGSIRDDEVIAAAREAGVTMYFTGTRHFAH